MECKQLETFKIEEITAWQKWKQKFNIYLKASGKSDSQEDVQIAILLNMIGDECLDIYNTFPQEKTKKIEDVIRCFDEYFLPKANITMETFKFHNIMQKDEQSIDSYIVELKSQAANCSFVCTNEECKKSYMDRMIKDKIILGIKDKQIQQRLIRETNMTLDKIQDYCKSIELSKQHIKLLTKSEEEEEVNFIKTKFKCKKCGYEHLPRKCPAFNKTCSNCQKKNHFAKMCYFKNNQPEIRQPNIQNDQQNEQPRENYNQDEQMRQLKIDETHKEVNEQEPVILEDDEIVRSETITNVFIYENKRSELQKTTGWYEDIFIDKHKLQFKLDSGAESSILPLKYLNQLNLKYMLEPAHITIVSYGNFKSKTIGQITLLCRYKNLKHNIKFLVVELNSEPLLGLNDCLKFKLICRLDSINNELLNQSELLPKDKNDIYKNATDLFEGLGNIPGFVNIKLKESAVPVIQTQRKVPLSLYKKLKESLDDLQNKNIISPVDYPTEWVNSLVIVEKPTGALRLCLDPKPLNKYICREHYLIPKCDDILSRLVGKTMFSVIDMKDGFWQLQLNKESSDLCTFSTPFGRFKFNRVPFGISSAPEIFQRKCYEIFGDIPGVEIYFDDIIIAGKTELDHDRALKCVIERALKNGIKFNYNKFQYKLKEVNFLGQIISETGIQPSNKNIEAVLAIEVPQNKKDILRILGMFKFFSKFIPNLSQLTYNMRNLTKNNIQFNWTSDHQNELDTLKTLITQKPILKIFNENKQITIQTDSSSKGMGYVLLQDNYPIAFGSRSLNKTEEKYAQIEKELLSIVVACEKFHYIIYGRDFIVQTDHKPLISIISKNLDQVSMRLQRLLLKLLKYNIKLEYIPGSKMYIADTLSRSFIKTETSVDEDMEYIIHSLSLNVPMTDEKKIVFKNSINQDPVLSEVKKFCQSNWPKNEKNMNSELKFYYKLKNNIYLSEDLLFYDTKIIVPQNLRIEMLQLIHETHFGIQKCKLRARQIMFWPKMSSDIENFVETCEICQLNKPANKKESLVQHDLPERPWQYLHSDFLEYENQYYLLIVDSYSHWLEVYPVKDKTADTVINICKDVFSKFGIPDIFYADNNPYNSVKFKDFGKQWNFQIEFSSPHHHQSNGLAEKYVDITKRMLKKMKSVKNLSYYLLEYRNTPLPSIGYSPSQILLSRLLKSKIPVCVDELLPKIVDSKNLKDKIIINREKQKEYYNKNSRDLPVLANNENILFQKNKRWEKGKIIKKYNNRSYILTDKYGNKFRRNRKLINKTKIPLSFSYNSIIYDDLLDSDNENDNNIDLSIPRNHSNEDFQKELKNLLNDDRVEVETDIDCNNLRQHSSRTVKLPEHLLKDYELY